MVARIESTRNTNEAATVSTGIALNATTSTVIAAANPNRIFFSANNNDSVQAAWLKLQAASADDDKKGIFLPKKGGLPWDMPTDNIYTGEISAVADAGTPVVYFTEY